MAFFPMLNAFQKRHDSSNRAATMSLLYINFPKKVSYLCPSNLFNKNYLQRMSKSLFRLQSFSKLFTAICLLLILPFFLSAQVNSAKPWAYWWWMGSAVNKADLKKNLEDFSAAGFGGLHIIPIYGVKGEEANFIPYLSPQWLSMLDYTCTEAKRLGLGIDMTLGTGWPFGGAQVKPQDAAQAFQVQSIDVKANEKITQLPTVPEKWKNAKLIAVSAYSRKAFLKKLDISKGISWELPQESNLYALYQLPTGQKVKRAAPGAEGWVLDHFNATAIKTYFQTFAQVFMAKNYGVRAFYNDSYEVYGANWTSTFVQKFQQLRGYDLLTHLDVLAQDTAITDKEKRVWADYHETISDVLLEDFTKPLMAWASSLAKLCAMKPTVPLPTCSTSTPLPTYPKPSFLAANPTAFPATA